MPAAQPQEIRLVAGLGNPGEEYENTRHNAGFRAIEELGGRLGAGYWKSQCGAKVAVVRVRGQEGPREVILAMPQDFMNTSGGPISKLCREYRVAPEELLVIHDELDLDPGDVRVKVGGGLGTALSGWLLAASGYDGNLKVQPESAIQMIYVRYVWLPLAANALILFLLMRLDVEKVHTRLKEEADARAEVEVGVGVTSRGSVVLGEAAGGAVGDSDAVGSAGAAVGTGESEDSTS